MSGFIITGAQGTISQALVKKLQQRFPDKQLFLIARNCDEATSDQLIWHQADVTDNQAVSTAIQQAHELLGEIHGVFHGVGSIMLKPAHLLTDNDWQQTLLTNLSSSFYLVRALTKLNQGNMSVVFCSSAAAKIGLPNHEAISAAKAGVEGLAKAAAATYAAKNIRFNVIQPGLVESKISAHLFKSDAAINYSTKMHGLGRLGDADKIASIATWLLDPENDWITGETIAVDGGLSTIKTPS